MSGFISFALNGVVSCIFSNLYDKCIDFAVIVGYVIVNGKKQRSFGTYTVKSYCYYLKYAISAVMIQYGQLNETNETIMKNTQKHTPIFLKM